MIVIIETKSFILETFQTTVIVQYCIQRVFRKIIKSRERIKHYIIVRVALCTNFSDCSKISNNNLRVSNHIYCIYFILTWIILLIIK